MSKKPDSSRFDALFGAAKSKAQPDPTPTTPTTPDSPAKSTNPSYVRTTVYLPKHLHKQLKAAAAYDEKDMSQIVEELIEQWLISRQDP